MNADIDQPAAARRRRPNGRGRRFTGTAPVSLSIVMPAYNECGTIAAAVDAVLQVEYPCPVELIVVDDGSSDATPDILAAMDGRIRVLRHPRNLGKGAALLSGSAVATGTHLLPFDADLEYDPNDIPTLLEPVLGGHADIVYGSRISGSHTAYQSYRYAMGSKLTTLAANVMFDAYMSDMHTCLKLVPLCLFRALGLRECGFGLDTEVTASLLRHGVRPFEVPVRYYARSHADGKKITWRDGVECLQILGRVRFTRPITVKAAPRSPLQSVRIPLPTVSDDDVTTAAG